MQTTEELQAALLIASEGMQAAKRIIERKNKQLLAVEAEIARLQSALDDLKEWAQDEKQKSLDGDLSEYNNAKYVMAALFVENINRITGTDK